MDDLIHGLSINQKQSARRDRRITNDKENTSRTSVNSLSVPEYRCTLFRNFDHDIYIYIEHQDIPRQSSSSFFLSVSSC